MDVRPLSLIDFCWKFAILTVVSIFNSISTEPFALRLHSQFHTSEEGKKTSILRGRVSKWAANYYFS